MKPKMDRWLDELSRYDTRDVNWAGLTKELIEDDVTFLKEILRTWEE